MKKISRAFVFFLAGIAADGFAAVPFETGMVPVELITELPGGNQVAVYRSLPDSFPVAPGLAGLPVSIVGSIDRGGRSSQVLLRSSLPPDQLRATLSSAYLADSWIEIPYEGELVLCSDTKGQLYMRLTGENTGTKVLISFAGPGFVPSQTTCAQLKQIREAQIAGGGNSVYPLVNARPTLEIPVGAVAETRNVGIIGTSSGAVTAEGLRYESTVEGGFKLAEYSLSQVFSHLAQQLQQQGWTVDSDDVGSSSGASVWFKTVPYTAVDGTSYDLKVTGFLKLLKKSGDSYSYVLDLETYVPLPAIPIIIRPAL